MRLSFGTVCCCFRLLRLAAMAIAVAWVANTFVAAEVIKVEAGQVHTMFLLSDGSVWASGYNHRGQLGDGTNVSVDRAIEVVGSGVLDIAAGYGHSLILRSDGSVWAAGANNYGQLGDGSVRDRFEFVEVVESGAEAVFAGAWHSLILNEDGSLLAMGYNVSGQLGDGSDENRRVPVEIVSSGVLSASAGQSHSLILKDDSSVWGMGENLLGQLSLSGKMQRNQPVEIFGSGYKGIAAGSKHSLFLDKEGALWAAGSNGYGQLGSRVGASSDVAVELLSGGVVSVSAGLRHNLILDENGACWSNGFNSYGQLGLGDLQNRSDPVIIPGDLKMSFVEAGYEASFMLAENGSAWGMGNNGEGAFGGTLNYGTLSDPIQLKIPPPPLAQAGVDVQVVDLDGSGSELVVLDGSSSRGSLGTNLSVAWSWSGISRVGEVIDYDFPLGETRVRIVVTDDLGLSSEDELIVTVLERPEAYWNGNPSVVKVASGKGFSMVVRSDGSLWSTGANEFGQLGDGTTVDRARFEQIIPYGVVDVAVGDFHALIQMEGGRLLSVGNNGYGQLGDDKDEHRSTPVEVLSSDVSVVEARGNSSMLLMEDGSVMVVGDNAYGQLGVGNAEGVRDFVQVYSEGVSVIDLGARNHLVVRQDGSLWGSGSAATGILGESVLGGNALSPVEIIEDGVVDLSLGAEHSLILLGTSEVLGMGMSSRGQLGLNSVDPIRVPRSLFSTEGVLVEAGDWHSFVLLADGELMSSGYNVASQLGDGSEQSRFSFARARIDDVSILSTGTHSLLVDTVGSLWGWGVNYSGELGEVGEGRSLLSRPVLIFDGPDSQTIAIAGNALNAIDLDSSGREGLELDGSRSEDDWGIVSWEWIWDGGSANGERVIVEFPIGVTRVNLTVTNLRGVSDSEFVDVTVLSPGSEQAALYEWLSGYFDAQQIGVFSTDLGGSDPDFDGLSNAQEMALDLDPSDFDSRLSIAIEETGSRRLLQVSPASRQFLFRVWSSGNCKQWNEEVGLIRVNRGNRFEYDLPEDGSRFYRVSVESVDL